ncbi:hypothetical protein [Roseibium sp. ROS1]
MATSLDLPAGAFTIKRRCDRKDKAFRWNHGFSKLAPRFWLNWILPEHHRTHHKGIALPI